MKTIEQNENRRLNIFIQVCGLLTVFLGISAVLGWILNIPQLASFDSSKIPMAISTAVLFVAFGFTIFFYQSIISNRVMFRVGVVISIIGIIIALLLFYLALVGIHPGAGHLGIGINFAVAGLIVGQMSPATAFCFVLVGLSFLIILTKPGRKKLIKTSLIFAVIIIFVSIILLISYLLGTPLLYEGSFIPPALTTSLAFFFLGTALLLISGLKVWSYEELSNALSTRYTFILALVFFVLIISIMTAGYSYYKSYERQFRLGIEQQLSSIASLKVHQILQWRKERLGDAKILYKNAEFSKLVKRFFNNQNDLDAKKGIQEWIDIVHSTYQYESISLHDLKGRELVSSPTWTINSHLFFPKLLSEIQKSGEIIFKDFYRDEIDLRIYLGIFIPIQSDNNLISILDLRLDPQQYLYPLINEWPTPSKTAETLIVRREGKEVVFLNELKFQKNTALNLRRPLTETNLASTQAAFGKKGIIEGIDYRGVPVLAYVCPIPNSPWFLVARIDIAEVYAPLREWFWAITILVVVLLTGLGTSIGFIWRNQRSKFHKERFETGKTLQHLSTRYEAILASVPEIIMEVDNKKKYTWCNAAGLEFFGNNVIGKDALYYFEGEQDTYKSVKQLFDGSKEIVYVESWQRRKDGKKRLLAWWCKVLKDENGVVTGALSSAQDITERKKAELELLTSETKYRSFFENSMDAILLTSPDGTIFSANPAACKMFGYSTEELIKLDRAGVIDTADPRLPVLLAERALKGKAQGELTFIRKDGTHFPADISSAIFKNHEGLERTSMIIRDITERKRVEETLLQSEAKFRKLINSLPDPVLVVNTHGQIVYCNEKSMKIFDYNTDEMLNNNIEDLIPKDFREHHIALMNKYISEPKSRPMGEGKELFARRKGGSEFPTEIMLEPVEINNNKFILAIVRDITERKRAEEEITMLAHSLKSINECVSITDMEDKIIFVNHSFLETYGFREEELIGKQMTLVRSPNNPPELVSKILPATILGGWHGELWNKRKDGSEFLIYLSTTLIKDKDGKSIGLIGVAIDVTERKRAEKELIAAKERAEESDKLKTEFLAQMSHEIRTPINIIIGNTDYLNESIGKNMDSDTRDCFDGIDLASKRIIRTIDLILNASELQTSGYKPDLQKVNLDSEILRKLYNEHQLSAKQKGLELIYKNDIKKSEVMADEYSITQIFANLIDNAIKFTQKGKVEIHLLENKTGNIIVEIKDTGIGMNKEFIPRMFEPFVQEEQGYSRSYDGNGLGLALVKDYCEINNTTLEVESEKNVGSTFRVIFKD